MRSSWKHVGGAVLTSGVVLVTSALIPAPASAEQERAEGARAPVRVIADKLNGPFGLDRFRGGFVVAESMPGRVTLIDRRGGKRTLVSNAPGVAGVAAGGARIFSVLGGENESGTPEPGAFEPTSVLRTRVNGRRTAAIANLLKHELKHNPDGQVQFVDGKPVDALSNPFAITRYPGGLLVADGGANSVLWVHPRTGRVRTFFVPPTVKDVDACLEPDAQANPGTRGCDPVPTGVVFARGSVYVSTLGAEVPGAGRVYKLNPRNGRVQRVWKRLTGPTGVAVANDGAIYVSEVLQGAPAGDPPPGFDPSTVGRITRIAPSGRRTHAEVTMPVGLVAEGGRLYSTAWAIAFFLGMQDAGQVVQVNRGAFR